jgi:hypothetical protein
MGRPLSAATVTLCRALSVQATVLPASDHPVRTTMTADGRELNFHTFYVRKGTQMRLDGVRWDGLPATVASLYRGVLDVFILDQRDSRFVPAVATPGIAPIPALMPTAASQRRCGGEQEHAEACPALIREPGPRPPSAVARLIPTG